jgi:hypothetical protein
MTNLVVVVGAIAVVLIVNRVSYIIGFQNGFVAGGLEGSRIEREAWIANRRAAMEQAQGAKRGSN